MKLPFYWIDAFTDRVFSGNPAGVVPLAEWLPDAVMQKIAFENGLAETAFFVPIGANEFHLRWFTPAIEVDLCGHATLATAHVLFNELGTSGKSIMFNSRSGPLHATTVESGMVELNFPTRPANTAATEPLGSSVSSALGLAPRELLQVNGLDHFLACFEEAKTVRSLTPDYAALARMGDVRVIATAPGGGCDFVSRFFAPGAGIPEDPVTGSAHCTLVPYWAKRLGKTKLHARQISARGGELFCELKGERVHMAGHSVCYLRGDLSV
ncbi:MAG: PhzF family phenazine biosynthesis protein [Nibricoccus sp.]